ncbi:MAG: hypothetical protein ACI81R_002429 [Bradymonadia bacterium]|jgi:hypothetical protein
MVERDRGDEIAAKRFLGPEFMLWLWHRSDVADGQHVVDDENIELHFDDQLKLEAHLAEAEQSALKGGAPAHSPEAHQALQVGKRVAKAKLRLMKVEREWIFTLDAQTFRMSGVKTPTILTRDEDEPLFERLFLIEELEAALFGLYQLFLNIRLDSDWEKTRQALSDWIDLPFGPNA